MLALLAMMTLQPAQATIADLMQAPGLISWGLLGILIAATASSIALLVRQVRLRRVSAKQQIKQLQLADLLAVWFWETDAQHRLTLLRPPYPAPDEYWAMTRHQGVLLWDWWQPADSKALLSERLLAKAPLWDMEVTWPTKGKAQIYLLRGVARYNYQGQFEGYLGTLTEAGTPLASHAVETDAGLGCLGRELTTQQVQAMLEEQKAFSYAISHDLRAPLRVVDGFARILKEDYGKQLDRLGQDHLERVLSAAARMNMMIDALLSQAELAHQPLKRQPVDLSQLALFIIDDLRKKESTRLVEVSIEPDLQAAGDPILLRIVLENLLGNAWKYSAKKEVAAIQFGRTFVQGRWVFQVKDNGAGFDMRYADRLFGMFQRLHSATDYEGTGVGLASVKKIIGRHGGQIWVESKLDQGTVFSFTLETEAGL